jgi:hypothetical protein
MAIAIKPEPARRVDPVAGPVLVRQKIELRKNLAKLG